MAQVSFSNTDIIDLSRLLQEREGVEIRCNPQISGIWLHDENWETELRLLILADIRITVSRVCFRNRRQGTMTVVMEWLVGFCRRNKIPTICIQSVETWEMAAFCQKHGFRPNPLASMLCNQGFVIGDYLFDVDDTTI